MCDLRLQFSIAIFCIPSTKNRMRLQFLMGHQATALDLVTFTYFQICLYGHIWYQNFQNFKDFQDFILVL